MNHTTLFGTALLAAVVTLAALVGAGAATAGPGTAPQLDTNETAANTTAPGAQLAGVIGVQQAEVDGDLDNRSFGVRIAKADNEIGRAHV